TSRETGSGLRRISSARQAGLVLGRTRFRKLAMKARGEARGRDFGKRRLQLVRPAGDDVARALHHRVESLPRGACRIGRGHLREFRVLKGGAGEEFRIRRSRHQAGDGDAAPAQFLAEGESETVDIGLGGVVDGLIGTGHESGDRAGEEDAPFALPDHPGRDAVDEAGGAGDIRVDDTADFVPVLVDEGMTEAAAGIGEESGDRTAGGGGDECVHAICRGEIGLYRFDPDAGSGEPAGGLADRGFVGGDHEIEAVHRTDASEFVADAGRGAGDDGEGAGIGCHGGSSGRRGFRANLSEALRFPVARAVEPVACGAVCKVLTSNAPVQRSFEAMKNPWMSLWLSSANSAAGAARGFWTAEMRRQQAALAKAATPRKKPKAKR